MKAVLAILLLALTLSVQAQTTYRWVDPATGRTVFSDQPPPPNARQASKREQPDTGDERQMPYATRMAAEKFPVVFYTSADCIEQCRLGRNLLNGRGIPFQEKMVQPGSPDHEELKRLSGGEAAVPFLVVGRQNYKGFEAEAWNNLLDLAGYPKSAGFGARPSGVFSQ